VNFKWVSDEAAQLRALQPIYFTKLIYRSN